MFLRNILMSQGSAVVGLNPTTDVSMFSFDGTDDYVDGGNGATLQTTTNVSLSAFVRTSSDITSDQAVISKWTSSSGYILYVFGSEIIMQINDSSNKAVFAIGTNTTYHFLGTYDGTNIKIYIDGVLKATSAYAASIGNPAVNALVGKYDSTFSDMDITSPIIFDVGLTAANATTLYNSGNPQTYSVIDTGITNDAVLAYEMSSRDSTLNDLSAESNNGTASGGVSANGATITYDNT